VKNGVIDSTKGLESCSIKFRNISPRSKSMPNESNSNEEESDDSNNDDDFIPDLVEGPDSDFDSNSDDDDDDDMRKMTKIRWTPTKLQHLQNCSHYNTMMMSNKMSMMMMKKVLKKTKKMKLRKMK
jgi:hypothetical protein